MNRALRFSHVGAVLAAAVALQLWRVNLTNSLAVLVAGISVPLAWEDDRPVDAVPATAAGLVLVVGTWGTAFAVELGSVIVAAGLSIYAIRGGTSQFD